MAAETLNDLALGGQHGVPWLEVIVPKGPNTGTQMLCFPNPLGRPSLSKPAVT